jgi:hypothetical protein
VTLHADDGTPLKPKEGVVLDTQGRPLTREPLKSWRSRSFGVVSTGRLSLPVIIGLAIFIPILVTAGFAIAAIAGILFALFLANQKLGRLFRSGR